MNIHELETINDLTLKELREISRVLKKIGYFEKEEILETIKENSKINPINCFNFLVENKFLEKDESKNNSKWTTTLKLRAIAIASLSKRKNSEKAWEEVAKLLARTVVLNESLDWSIETPSKLFLFGSMLDPNKKDYGDADLSVVFDRKDEYEVLQEKQKEWFKTYSDFISSRFYNYFGFSNEAQIRQDMMAGSSFPSVHYINDIIMLSEQPDNINSFPVFTLWENPQLTKEDKREDISTVLNLSHKWKTEHPEVYKEIQNRLNKALSNLGIVSYTDSKFSDSCKEYVKREVIEELTKKLKNNKKMDGDSIIVNRIVRLGDIGFEAIGKVSKQLPNFFNLISQSKLRLVLEIINKKENKDIFSKMKIK